MWSGFRDYFGLSNRQARGAFVLDSLVALMEHDDKQAAASRRYRDHDNGNQMHSDPAVRRMPLHAFDPNQISVTEWQAVGAPRWLAERIEK